MKGSHGGDVHASDHANGRDPRVSDRAHAIVREKSEYPTKRRRHKVCKTVQ